MGGYNSRVISEQYTSSASAALDTLEHLIRLSERVELMTIKETMRLTTTVNTYSGTDASLEAIIDRQLQYAKQIEKRVLEAQGAYAAEVRKHSNISLHFNDNDGDDILFAVRYGVAKLVINGTEYPVRIQTAIPPVIVFGYTGNEWTWNVNFDTKKCVGHSPRRFTTKKLESVLKNDSILEITL